MAMILLVSPRGITGKRKVLGFSVFNKLGFSLDNTSETRWKQKNDGHIFGKTIGLKWEVINKIIKWLIKRLVQISASLKGDFL